MHLTLKRKLVLLIVGVSLPFFLLWAVGFQWRIHEATQGADVRVLGIAQSRSDEVRDLVGNTHNLLRLLVEVPVLREGPAPARNAFLAQINRAFPALYDFLLLDRAGAIVASGLGPGAAPVRAPRWSALELSRILASTQPVLGAAYSGPGHDRFLLPMAFAVRDRAGTPEGILIALLDSMELQKVWARIPLPRDSTIALINRNRLILARSLQPQVYVGKHIPDSAPLTNTVLRESRGVIRVTYLTDKITRILGFAHVRGTPWDVTVGIPTAAVLGPVWRSAFLEGILMILAVLAALVVAVRLGRRIVIPVNQLVEAADRLAHEDYEGAQVSIPPGDEIGHLGARFEEMREKLHGAKVQKEQWEAQLVREVAERTAELTALNALAGTVGQSLDLDRVLSLTLEKVCAICDGSGGHVHLLDKSTRELVGRAYRGISGEEAQRIGRFRVGEGVIGRVFEENSPVIVEDIANNPAYHRMSRSRAALEMGYHSMAFLPLQAKGEILGVLAVFSRKPRIFTRDKIRFLTPMAQQVAMAIENANLYRELKQAYEEIQKNQEHILQAERLRVVGEIASGVAHDFNNLLVSILAYAELLQGQVEDPEKLQRGLKVIEKAALDGKDAVRRLQEYTGHGQESDFSRVDMREVVRDALDQTRPRWFTEAQREGREINVACELGEVPPVLGRASELREVLANLILNGIQAMPRGGRISVRTFVDHGEVLVELQDSGVGMSPEIQARIFEPFYTTRGTSGTGLGLSIANGIIRRHGGSIRARSRPGSGTTFTVCLPPAPEEKVQSPAEKPEAEKPQPRRAFILAVDDDIMVRGTLEEILLSAGHRVDVAAGGEEALELFSRKNYDLVVTDLGMPGMNGWELCRRIKEDKPSVPVVLVTGWGDRIEADKAKSHGVDLLVAKPFRVARVLREIDAVLNPSPETVAPEATGGHLPQSS